MLFVRSVANLSGRTSIPALKRPTIKLPRQLSPARALSSLQSQPEDIIDQCHAIRSSIQAINDKYKGPLEKSSQKNTILPFVFLLGNHSSGKSSFINYILQRKVQSTGVAPTDDTFTILAPGPSDMDKDGPALIGDPDTGFNGLVTFGPQLVHHTQLKVRANTSMKSFMMIDSPGMIDSPHNSRNNYGGSNAISNTQFQQFSNQSINMDRGYDFEGVCRWFAQRADVILLFFDPDKPGTTGETLSILTNSLVGLEHKLHIILNKADQFHQYHDFARAYGSLCWNLSKVIQRKDLPRIYTMCLPPAYHAASGNNNNQNSVGDGALEKGKSLMDLAEAREAVVAECFNAPKRRIDNEVSRLTDSLQLLQMHLKIVEDIQKQYRASKFKYKIAQLGFSSVGVGLGSVIFFYQSNLEVAIATGSIGLIITGLIGLWEAKAMRSFADSLVNEYNLEAAFRRQYARKIAEKDEDTVTRWIRVLDIMKLGLTGSELMKMAKISSSDVKSIENKIETQIPQLRRAAGPALKRN